MGNGIDDDGIAISGRPEMITHDDPAEVLCMQCGWLKAAHDREDAVCRGSRHDCDRDADDLSYI